MIYMFLSNNPSSGDINSSNLSCFSYYAITNFAPVFPRKAKIKHKQGHFLLLKYTVNLEILARVYFLELRNFAKIKTLVKW